MIVLTGEGRAFSAGVDLKALGDRRLVGGKVGDILDLPARRVIDLIHTTNRIVIAKVNGHCFTGALEIALACDIVVAADEAVFGDTHTKWGLRPTWDEPAPTVACRRGARPLPVVRARTFSGHEAALWGIVARSCPRSELDDVVGEIVTDISENSAAALAAYKDLYRASERGSHRGTRVRGRNQLRSATAPTSASPALLSRAGDPAAVNDHGDTGTTPCAGVRFSMIVCESGGRGFAWLDGAPGRIRTCAHGSGGRCSIP